MIATNQAKNEIFSLFNTYSQDIEPCETIPELKEKSVTMM